MQAEMRGARSQSPPAPCAAWRWGAPGGALPRTQKALWNSGTFQNRAKVVNSLPGYASGTAGCMPNLTTRAKRSMRLSISTEGTIRLLQSPFVGARSLKRL